jgi:hypothetical protein
MKSAYEIAMEKLRKKDAAEGIVETPLGEDQKDEIAEIRKHYGAKIAEREILYEAEQRKAALTGDPEQIRNTEDAYRRDRELFESEMQAKIRAVRTRAKAD